MLAAVSYASRSPCYDTFARPRCHRRRHRRFAAAACQLITGGILVACTAYGGRIVVNAWSAHQAAMAEEAAREARENPQPPPDGGAREGGAEAGGGGGGAEQQQQGGAAAEEKPFNLDEWVDGVVKMVKNFEFRAPSAESVKVGRAASSRAGGALLVLVPVLVPVPVPVAGGARSGGAGSVPCSPAAAVAAPLPCWSCRAVAVTRRPPPSPRCPGDPPLSAARACATTRAASRTR